MKMSGIAFGGKGKTTNSAKFKSVDGWYYHYKTKNTYRSALLEKGGKYYLCSELLYKTMDVDFIKKYSLLY